MLLDCRFGYHAPLKTFTFCFKQKVKVFKINDLSDHRNTLVFGIMFVFKWLSSLELTWWLLISLVMWFVLGSSAASWPTFQDGLSGMNALLVYDWLRSRGIGYPWVLLWLGALVFLAAILGVNLAACLWKRIQNRHKAQGLRLWIFIAMHILFGLVMIVHGLETMIGEKYPKQTVQAGDVVLLSSGWKVHIKKVIYVDDPQMLRLDKQEARRAMTRDSFDLQANRVDIALSHQGQVVEKGHVRMLQPLHHAGFHIVLRGFAYSSQGVEAQIKVVSSPFHTAFFIVYALFITSLVIWLVLLILTLHTKTSNQSFVCIQRQ